MFCINKNEELTTELLDKMIGRFRINVQPKLEKYKNYYDGIQAILKKEYSDKEKPCNTTVINYCKNIVDSYCGYLATPGYITYKSNNDIEEIMDVLKYNDYQTEDNEFLLNALVYGVAAELMYIDSSAHTRFRQINPTQCFGVFDDSLTNDLMYFVRMYKASDWDNTDLYYVDVYTDTQIKHFKMNGMMGGLTFMSEEAHFFNQCPANIFMLPDERSIFDCIMTNQDSVNTLLSAEIDDYLAFCDAYLGIYGADFEEDDVAAMKKNRVLCFPDGASANWLVKPSNDAQIENILKRLQDTIYKISSCVDFSSETFLGGVSSGIAIQYRLSGMETRAGKIEAEMKKALVRRIEIICGIATLKLGEDSFTDIQIDFKRNVPEDITSTINVVNSLKGIVSDETLLSIIPYVEDVQAEKEALQEQKAKNMELYGFGNPIVDDEEEDA